MKPDLKGLYRRDLARGLEWYTQELNKVVPRDDCEESRRHLVNLPIVPPGKGRPMELHLM